MRDEALCERVVSALAAGDAGWYQRHMAVITAATRGRYETMTQAMEPANMEPVIIEEFVTFGMERGEVRGRVQSLLRVLEARKLTLTDAERATRLACADLKTLDRWITRAATCTTAAAVFAPPQRRARRA